MHGYRHSINHTQEGPSLLCGTCTRSYLIQTELKGAEGAFLPSRLLDDAACWQRKDFFRPLVVETGRRPDNVAQVPPGLSTASEWQADVLQSSETAPEKYIHLRHIFDKVRKFISKYTNRLFEDGIFVGQAFCNLIALVFDVGSDLGQNEGRVDKVIAICKYETKFTRHQLPAARQLNVVSLLDIFDVCGDTRVYRHEVARAYRPITDDKRRNV